MAQRILVFEADTDFAKEIETGFSRYDANLEIVADGRAGLKSASDNRPDLILLSIELPSMNGFLVCKKIKKNADLKDIPLVIMSSDANADEIFEQHKKLRTRAEEYVRKPVAFTDLVDRVKKLVALKNGVANSEQVDAEIEAFADDAFDALVMENPSGSSDALDVSDLEDITTKPRATALSDLPPANAPAIAKETAELDKLRSKVRELEGELLSATSRAQDADRLQNELSSLQSRSQAPGRSSAAAASREVLDLREKLNRKEKELLDLQDEITSKEKVLLDLRSKNTQHQRSSAHFEDKLISLERDLTDKGEQLETLTADREAALKRYEGLKGRFDRAEDKTKKLTSELEVERSARAEEVKTLHTDIAELKVKKESEIDQLRNETSAKIAKTEAEHDAALKTLRAEHAKSIDSARSEHEGVVSTLKNEHAAAMEAMRTEHANTVETLKNEHAAELKKTQDNAASSQESALSALRSELTDEKTGALAAAAATAAAVLAARETELKNDKANEVARLEQSHSDAMDELGGKLSAAEGKLSTANANITELESSKTQLTTSLEALREEHTALTSGNDALKTEHEAAKAKITELESTKSSNASKITELENAKVMLEETVASMTAKLSRAKEKIAQDDELLDRARKAMKIGLGLLDDQRKNVFEDD